MNVFALRHRLASLLLVFYLLPVGGVLAQTSGAVLNPDLENPTIAPESQFTAPIRSDLIVPETPIDPARAGSFVSVAPASETSALPSVPKKDTTDSVYHSQWAQKSVQVLQENGIQLPPGINYGALISHEEFIQLLATVSSVTAAQLRTALLFPQQGPQSGLTRGEAVHLMVAAFGLSESLKSFAEQDSKFKDLPKDHPAYASIVLAERVHLINGYPDSTIRPNEELSWGEALILMETIYSWRKALPTTAPEWVENYQKKQNLWYQLIDGFRLMLTLAYLGVALFFMIRTWRKARRKSQSPYRNFSMGLAAVTVVLSLLWISELLFNYYLIPREVYACLTMLSVFVSLFLLKLSADIDSDINKPKPQSVIDSGYISSVNYDKGEIFIKDRRSQGHSLALVNSDTQILRKTGRRSVENAFLSDFQVGDLVSLRGNQLEHESLLEIERITLVESAVEQQEKQQEQESVREYIHTPQQQVQEQMNHIVRKPPQS